MTVAPAASAGRRGARACRPAAQGRRRGGSGRGASDTPDGFAELFRRYFAVQTPFAQNESRKHEFPAAAALLRLEEYSMVKSKIVICVVQDSSWKDFSSKSD